MAAAHFESYSHKQRGSELRGNAEPLKAMSMIKTSTTFATRGDWGNLDLRAGISLFRKWIVVMTAVAAGLAVSGADFLDLFKRKPALTTLKKI